VAQRRSSSKKERGKKSGKQKRPCSMAIFDRRRQRCRKKCEERGVTLLLRDERCSKGTGGKEGARRLCNLLGKGKSVLRKSRKRRKKTVFQKIKGQPVRGRRVGHTKKEESPGIGSDRRDLTDGRNNRKPGSNAWVERVQLRKEVSRYDRRLPSRADKTQEEKRQAKRLA